MTNELPDPLDEHLYALVKRLLDADGMLAMFDFDGSLAPIEDHPDEVTLPLATRTALQNLRDARNVQVGIVSGRGLEDLRTRVGIDGVAYAGNHGLELDAGDERLVHPVAEDARDDIRSLCDDLETRLATVEGAFVENKGVSASIHYRLVSDDRVSAVERAVREVAHEPDDVRLTSGKQVFELRPDVDWHKGRAIRWLYDRYVPDEQTWVPLYVGDDVTDEDAFDVLPESGLGVKVGSVPPTVAGYRVSDPTAVRSTVEWLAEYGVEFLQTDTETRPVARMM
ncbi:trehalose-phosphatase [Haladaptatus sp. NG-WS-4]